MAGGQLAWLVSPMHRCLYAKTAAPKMGKAGAMCPSLGTKGTDVGLLSAGCFSTYTDIRCWGRPQH